MSFIVYTPNSPCSEAFTADRILLKYLELVSRSAEALHSSGFPPEPSRQRPLRKSAKVADPLPTEAAGLIIGGKTSLL